MNISHSVTVNQLNMYYQIDGHGHPIVLLHGWPTSSYLWRNIIPSLGRMGTVVAPDLIGFGLSDKPVDSIYTLSFHVEILNTFFHLLDIQEVTLVVHDLGGPIGLLWAVRQPERVKRLVIMDTFISPDLAGFSTSMKLILLAARTPGIRQLVGSPAGIARILQWGTVHRHQLTSPILSTYQAPFMSVQAQRVLLKTLTDPRLWEMKKVVKKLPYLQIPTLIIYGSHDNWFKAEQVRLEHLLPHAESTIIPHGGHFIQEDQPQEVVALLENFLLS